jgi:hypothetical protein
MNSVTRLLAFTTFFSLFASSQYALASYSDFPFGSLTADIQSKIINQGSHQLSGTDGITLSSADEAAGYRHIKIDILDIHAGVYTGWFLDSRNFFGTLFGAGLTILPVAGGNVISDRFAPDAASAASLASYEIPAHASQLANWHESDSITYTLSGGLIFSAGIGYAMIGLSGDYYARGDWTTYVEKLDGHKASVKITNLKLSDFDLMAGNILASEILSKFNKADSFFSYTFDLSNEHAAQAYEAMIHGSLKPAQLLAASHPELVQLDLTEKGRTSGSQKQFFLGLPFLNLSRTSGQLYNFSDTVFHTSGERSDVDYGLYWTESDNNLFAKHDSNSKAFYGISYNNLSSDLSGPVTGQYGKLILSYENDHSDAASIKNELSQMIKRTGLRDQLALKNDLPAGNLGYSSLGLTLVISEIATQKLLTADFSEKLNPHQAQTEFDHYFKSLNDPDSLCDEYSLNPQTAADYKQTCEDNLNDDVQGAINDMQSALKDMNQANAAHKNADFVRAYAAFGKAMLKNQITFNTVANLLGNQGMDITFEAMGSRFSKLSQKI